MDSTVDGAQPASVTDMDEVVSYYNHKAEKTAENIIPNHTCTVRFTSYNSTDGAMDYLGYGKMLTRNSNGDFEGYGYYLSLAGPTVFENIALLDISKQGQYWDNPVNIRNNTAIFSGVKWSYIKESGEIVNDAQKASARDLFYAGNTQSYYNLQYFERSESITQTIAFEGDNQYNLPKSFAFGNSNSSWEYGGKKFNGNTTFVWGIENKTLNTVYLAYEAGTDSSLAFNYNGNVNIVMKNGARVSNIKVKPDGDYITPNITGAVQIVANAGSEINTSDIEAIAKVYTDNNIYAITNGSSDITLDVTDTAGKYSVNGNGIAYIETSEKIYYSVNSILTVPGVNGLNSYEIKYAKSADEIIGDGTVWQYSGTAGVLIPKQGEKYMLHVKGAIANDYLGLKTASGKITAGNTYTLSFKYRTECGINIFGEDYVRIKLMSGKKALRQTVVQKGSDTNTKIDSAENNKFESVVLNDDTMIVTFSLTKNEAATDDYRIAFVFIGRGGYDKWEYYIKDLRLCAENSDENILINTGVKADMQGYYADTAEAVAGSAVFNYSRTVNGEPTGDKYLAEYVSYYNTNADASFDICDLVAASDIIKSNTNFYTSEDVDLLRYRLLAQ